MATPKTLTLTDDRTQKAYELYGKAKVDNAIAKQAGVGQVVKAPSIGQPMSPIINKPDIKATTQVNNSIGANMGAGVPNGPVAGSVNSVLGDGTLTPYEQALADKAAADKALADGTVDEESIRSQALAARQAQLDATTQVYADQLNRARVVGQGRVGSGTAMQARSGLLGSDFGAAQANNIENINTDIYNAIDAEKNAALQAIISEGRNDATAQIAAKRAAKEAGGAAYLEYLRGDSDRKSAKTANAAKKLLALGQDPNSLSEADIKKAGYNRDDLIMAYNELKAQADSAQATAQAASDKAALENSKTQAEIDKLNYESSKNYEQGGFIYDKDGNQIAQVVGKNYEAGGKIYEAGTNKYIGDARSVSNSSSSNSSSSNANNAGNIVTRKLNNGQNITTGSNVADGLNIAVATIPGIRFDTQNATRTADDQAKLYGKGRTAEELQAAGVNPAYAQPGQSRVTWTLNSNHMSGNAVDVIGDKNYLDSIEKQMNAAGFVRPKETMARGDYGHFEYQGSTSQLSDLAQSVQKGIITIAQIPAAQRAQVAAELSQAGQNSPKSVELQNSLSLVDTMLQDEEALKSISGWWGGRLPLTGLFSNQLAANQFDQLKGILSLGEREKLKGSGAISDFESKMLAQAASALGRNLSEEDFKAELEKIRDILSGKYKYYTEGGTNTGTVTPTGNTGTGGVVNGAI